MPIIYESKADPRHRSGNGKEEKVFDAFEKKYQCQVLTCKLVACGVGPRQTINFMSQLWKKEVDFRLRMAIWELKLP